MDSYRRDGRAGFDRGRNGADTGELGALTTIPERPGCGAKADLEPHLTGPKLERLHRNRRLGMPHGKPSREAQARKLLERRPRFAIYEFSETAAACYSSSSHEAFGSRSESRYSAYASLSFAVCSRAFENAMTGVLPSSTTLTSLRKR